MRGLSVLAVVVALGATSCGSGSSTITQEAHPTTPPPEALQMSVAQTATALQHQGSAVAGAWSLLHHLNIGVYTASGAQLLAGSESGPSDFWLYDFMVPWLAHTAGGPPTPFSQWVSGLASAGLKADSTKLLTFYQSVYSQNAASPVAQLFAALGLSFQGDPMLTPLEQWLLFVDTLVAPNGGGSRGAGTSGAGSPSASGASSAAARVHAPDAYLADSTSCSISGDGLRADWGTAYAANGASQELGGSEVWPVSVGTAQAQAEMFLLTNGALTVTVNASQGTLHLGMSGPGDSSTLSGHVEVNLGTIPNDIRCGSLSGWGTKTGDAPIKVVWSSSLESYGKFTTGAGAPYNTTVFTEIDADSGGNSTLVYTTDEDPGQGQGMERMYTGYVSIAPFVEDYLVAHGVPPSAADLWKPFGEAATQLTVVYHADDLKIAYSANGVTITGLKCNGPKGSWDFTEKGTVSRSGATVNVLGSGTITLPDGKSGNVSGHVNVTGSVVGYTVNASAEYTGTVTWSPSATGGTLNVMYQGSGEFSAVGITGSGAGGNSIELPVEAGAFCPPGSP